MPALVTGLGGTSGVGEETVLPHDQSVARGLVPLGEDQQILKQHELALQRLEQLQGDMVGGEKGGGCIIQYVYMYVLVALGYSKDVPGISEYLQYW